MLSIVDLALYAIIVALTTMLLVAYASDGWTNLEKKSSQTLQQNLALGAGS